MKLILGGREKPGNFYTDNDFSLAVYSSIGPLMLKDEVVCVELWESLTNTVWTGRGESYLFSFRSAGDLIASILDTGNYTDWYCCGTPGRVSNRIAKLLKKAGFSYAEVRSDPETEEVGKDEGAGQP